MIDRTIMAFVLMNLIAACDASSLSTTASTGSVSPVTTTEHSNGEMSNILNELDQFVMPDTKVLAAQKGDLNADSLQDIVLLLESTEKSDEAKLGDGVNRSLALLVRDLSGNLRKAAENDRIVPCRRCGGTSGDPFGYIRVGRGSFMVLIEGGSRERWSSEFAFKYSDDLKHWLLSSVKHMVVDTITGQDKAVDLGQDDFGIIEFEQFDPSKLPSPEGG